MAAYIYTVKDRQTGDVLFRGYQQECGDFIGCDPKYIWVLSEKKQQPTAKTKYAKYKVERAWDEGAISLHGGKREKDTSCLSCGKSLFGVISTRKRCPECAAKWKKDYNRQQMQARRNQPQTECSSLELDHIQADMQKPCIGCVYFTGMSTYARTCNYIFLEDHSRGCPPR